MTPPHGTRATYQRFTCRCTPCRAANAAYQQALRRLQAHGKRPLGSLIAANILKRLVRGMLVDGFTFTHMAQQLGLKCPQFRVYSDQVTLRRYLALRRLYRQRQVPPDSEHHVNV